MTRQFDLGDILSITEGSLVSPRHIGGVYDILGYMTGESLFTHALPRAAIACAPVLLAQHPQLADVHAPEWDRSGDVKAQIDEWLAVLRLEYGDTLPVEPMTEWHSIDPIQELVEMTERPDKIIRVPAT